jgi:subtilase family serine protease
VGGTSLGVGKDGSRAVETGWGTSNYNCDATTLGCTRTGWLYGSGGGVSRVFAEPSYQTEAGLALGGRGVPDVAAVGDPQTGVDDSAGTVDVLRTFDDYSGSPTQHTNPGWDNVTGLGTPNGLPLP